MHVIDIIPAISSRSYLVISLHILAFFFSFPFLMFASYLLVNQLCLPDIQSFLVVSILMSNEYYCFVLT